MLASMVAIWCGNFIALKVCLRVLSPVGVTAFRVVAAALLLFFIQRYSPDRYAFDKLGKSDYWLFLKLAFVGLLMNQVLFISGLKFTTVAHSALVVTFGPLFTLLFAWQRGQEKLTSTSLFGMFQFKRDFEEYYCGARNLDSAKALNPSLQTFEAWLEQNKNRIPLD